MIKLDRSDAVWILTMGGGENRFHADSLDALHAALDQVEASSPPVALVTTGAGKFYSNGLDLDALATAPAGADDVIAGLHRLLGRMITFPMVTVAAVNGHAFAAGAMLAVAHDLAVMRSDRGYLCLPEADLGLPLTPAMFAVVTAKLPARAAQEAIVTGRRYGGTDAAVAGIVHRAVAEDRVLADATELAAGLAGKDRRTLAEHKRLLYGSAATACGVAARTYAGE
jgi:enoyl-CoA hydratase/carnithine racemase